MDFMGTDTEFKRQENIIGGWSIVNCCSSKSEMQQFAMLQSPIDNLEFGVCPSLKTSGTRQ
jgi:hypothetical protein